MFLIGGFLKEKNNYNCEMFDIKREIESLKTENNKNNLGNKFWAYIKINGNINIDRNPGLVNIKYIGNKRLVIFGGENNVQKNYSNYYILKYANSKKELDVRYKVLNQMKNSDFIFMENLLKVDN